MRAILSPLELPASLKQRLASTGASDRIAKADGLTEDEAFKLAAWLRSTGYQSIEVIYQAAQSTVLWKK